jgi:hypothetical protein
MPSSRIFVAPRVSVSPSTIFATPDNSAACVTEQTSRANMLAIFLIFVPDNPLNFLNASSTIPAFRAPPPFGPFLRNDKSGFDGFPEPDLIGKDRTF